ncbi:Holliday junction branch migration protein RuvA [Insolitispirillum peregrinum]|uniref:Holliday junction branch migration complex subunit RuvA n=1 Tax=Insolitispirillum peregrinum TaxID=80876 RepID=A0A1N7IQH3_9PROT|nr:Holliday junction branch migration protein RuvA [Insolitispirillum peregrinum]SIS39339.1 Holliday junction DNA helicase subunit RuvA [Insolitispirillum peregrinum]
MIAKLKGLIDSIGEDWVVVDVNGVGYLVHCSSRSLSRLVVGEAVSLSIETQVREDAITLFGFLSAAEKACFRLLTTVQGVGSKVGLSILSVGQPDQVAHALAAQDKAFFARAVGVGPKLAARIVSELKDKAANLAVGPAPMVVAPVKGEMALPPEKDSGSQAGQVVEDALSALVNLGYGRSEAFAAVSQVVADASGGISVQKAISAALKELGKGL